MVRNHYKVANGVCINVSTPTNRENCMAEGAMKRSIEKFTGQSTQSAMTNRQCSLYMK